MSILNDHHEEFASISEIEFDMVAESIMSSLGCEVTSENKKRIIELMRHPMYKCVDSYNEKIVEIKTKRAEAEVEAEKEKEEAMHGLLPEDHQSDDDLLFGFGLMQLLIYRMDRVQSIKKISLSTGEHDSTALVTGNTVAKLDDGKVIINNRHGDSTIFDLMDPNSINLIVDKIFIDS